MCILDSYSDRAEQSIESSGVSRQIKVNTYLSRARATSKVPYFMSIITDHTDKSCRKKLKLRRITSEEAYDITELLLLLFIIMTLSNEALYHFPFSEPVKTLVQDPDHDPFHDSLVHGVDFKSNACINCHKLSHIQKPCPHQMAQFFRLTAYQIFWPQSHKREIINHQSSIP